VTGHNVCSNLSTDMDRDILDTWLERGILALVLGILVFAPLATGAVRAVDFVVVEALTVAALGLWVARFWLNPSHRVQWPPICWAVVAFLAFVIIRAWQADVEYVARTELARLAVYTSVFLLVLNNLHRQETTRIVTYVVIGLGVLLSVYAIYQFAAKYNRVWAFERPPHYNGRGSGTFICPNHLAGYLEMLVPLALASVFLGRANHVIRVVMGYAALVMLAGIAVTLSRGGWIATSLSMFLFFGLLLRYRTYRRWVLPAIAVFAVGVCVFMYRSKEAQLRVDRMFELGQKHDISIRASVWRGTVELWHDHFWLGAGPGHFDVRFPAYRPLEVQSRPEWAHNDILNALADHGVAGAALIAAAIICLYVGALRSWRFVHRAESDLAGKRSDRAAFVFGSALGLAALLLHSPIEFNFQIPANALTAVVFMALLTSHLRFATGRYWVTPHLLGRVLATALGLAAIWFLGHQGLVRWRESSLLSQADKASTTEAYFKALEAAHSVEPTNPDTVYRLGEARRQQSWQGDERYREYAWQAMHWFDLGMRLNPYDPYPYLRYGMCLDWLGRHAQAAPFFRHARNADFNNYYVVALQGWHQMQIGNFLSAKGWFQRSLKIKWYANSLATSYLEIVNRQLQRESAK